MKMIKNLATKVVKDALVIKGGTKRRSGERVKTVSMDNGHGQPAP